MDRAIHVVAFDGYADWEPALALAELRRSAGAQVVTVGFSREPITSMGGLRVQIDRALDDVRSDEVGLLILPGGDCWEQGRYPVAAIERLLHACNDARVPVAAICGATVALARAGVFADRRHTSNDAGWLAAVAPGYAGSERYVNELAVRDGDLITASGAGPVEFARELLSYLGVMPEERLAVWYHLFKFGRFPEGVDPAAYFAEEEAAEVAGA